MGSVGSIPRRRVVGVVLAVALTLSGCGGTGGSSEAASAASRVASGLGGLATAVQSASATGAAAASASATGSASETAGTSTTASASEATSTSATAASTAATTSGSAASSAASGATTVVVRDDPKLGTILTDPSNRTLYWYTKDSPGTSTCTGGCLGAWPPFSVTGTPALPAGVPGKLGTITRSDGSTQVTYDDMPLYYYAKDAAPGDTSGQGVGKVWYVVTPTAGPLAPPAG